MKNVAKVEVNLLDGSMTEVIITGSVGMSLVKKGLVGWFEMTNGGRGKQGGLGN